MEKIIETGAAKKGKVLERRLNSEQVQEMEEERERQSVIWPSKPPFSLVLASREGSLRAASRNPEAGLLCGSGSCSDARP